MLLKLGTPEEGWREMAPGARVRFAPISIKAARAAGRAVAAALVANAEDDEEAGDAFSRELIRRGIVELEGFGDQDGNPIAATSESIELFIATPSAFAWADRVYVLPWVEREREKNAPSASSTGTGAAETAAPDIANSAAPQVTASGAPNARTASTNSRRKKARSPSK